MPLFRYKALSSLGKQIGGVIDADSIELAKERLRRERVLVTKLYSSPLQKEDALTPSMLLNFTRELRQLLEAGLPLYESLLTIAEKYRFQRAHSLFLDLSDRLKGGAAFSAILKSYPKTFDPIYISMVEAAERTGSLSWAFAQLYALIERRQRLRKQLSAALAYPLFLGIFCFAIVMGLLFFVVPSMAELFEGRTLHPLTQTVLSWSRFLQGAPFFIPIVLLAFFFLFLVAKSHWGKVHFQRLFQKVPLISTISMQAALIRFCRSTSLLLFGGTPLLHSLAISRRAMQHSLMEKVIEQAEKEIAQGRPLSSELRKSPHIPPLVPRMLEIAEETGKMPDMLQSLSDIYDQELERSLTHITTFLQPVLLVILGGVIGLMILSILLPLTDVSSLIST